MFGNSTVNKVFLVGYIAKDPKVKKTSDGKTRLSFVMATKNEWLDGQGELRIDKEWHNIVCYGKFAESIAERALVRNFITIEGRINTRSWVDDQNVKRYITEINITDGTYQTLRKVKKTEDFSDLANKKPEEITTEEKEAKMMDDIQNMLEEDIGYQD